MPRLATCLCLLVATRAHAADFQISPVKVALDARTPSSFITLSNPGHAPVAFQVSAFAWQQERDGAIALSPTDDVVFYPSLLQIEPGESRTIRVGTTLAAAGVERTYRIFIEELPVGDLGPGVHVLSRVGVPVFVAPLKSERAALFSHVSRAKGKLSLTLENCGSVHIQAKTVHIEGKDKRGRVVFSEDAPAWYVLAHGARDFSVRLPKQVCGVNLSLAAADDATAAFALACD